jgi:hypothetical protein
VERRTIWSFLKPADPVEKLAELDPEDPLIKGMASERAVRTVKKISPEEFYEQYRHPQLPVIIKGIANRWPGSTKWRDPHFFSDNFGKAHVPIEVGGNYLDSNWTQKLVTFKDFIEKYVTLESKYGKLRLKFTNSLQQEKEASFANHRSLIPQKDQTLTKPQAKRRKLAIWRNTSSSHRFQNSPKTLRFLLTAPSMETP